MSKELTDDEVFGAQSEMSDADVFGTPDAPHVQRGPTSRGRNISATQENLVNRARAAAERGVPTPLVEDALFSALRDRNFSVGGKAPTGGIEDQGLNDSIFNIPHQAPARAISRGNTQAPQVDTIRGMRSKAAYDADMAEWNGIDPTLNTPVDKIIRKLDAGMEKPFGGALQFAGEGLDKALGWTNETVRTMLDPTGLLGANAPLETVSTALRDKGSDIYREGVVDSADAMQGVHRPTGLDDVLADPNNAIRYYTLGATESAPLMGAGVMSGGVAPGLAIIGGGSGAQTFAEDRSGIAPDSFEVAAQDALANALIEAITEVNPLTRFLSPGEGKPIREALGTLGQEAGGEYVAGTTQQAASDLIHGRPVDYEEAQRQGVDGLIQALLLAGGPVAGKAAIDSANLENPELDKRMQGNQARIIDLVGEMIGAPVPGAPFQASQAPVSPEPAPTAKPEGPKPRVRATEAGWQPVETVGQAPADVTDRADQATGQADDLIDRIKAAKEATQTAEPLAPRAPAPVDVPEGATREQLVADWRAASTDDTRATAAARIAAFDQKEVARGQAEPQTRTQQEGVQEGQGRSQSREDQRLPGEAPADQQGPLSVSPQSGIEQGGKAQSTPASQTLDKALTGFFGQDVTSEEVEVPDSTPAGQRNRGLISAIKTAFGLDTKIVRLSQGADLFDGVTRIPGAPNVAFVNEGSSQPMLTVVGHELLHNIRRNHPDLYSELQTKLRAAGMDLAGYRANELDPRTDANNEARLSDGIAEEELIADTQQKLLTDPEFVNRLATEEPEMFQRFAKIVLDWIESVLKRLRADTSVDGRKYFKDIEAVKTAYADALTEAARRHRVGHITYKGTLFDAQEEAPVSSQKQESPAKKEPLSAGKRYDKDGNPVPASEFARRDGESVDDWEKRVIETQRNTIVTSRAKTAGALLRDLTPAEKNKVTDKVAGKILESLKQFPTTDEMAAVAIAGRAKKGWYADAVTAISEVFGPDAPRFAALLAATSPQVSLEENLRNALLTWTNWVDAGRPQDSGEIARLMPRTFGAWTNNTVRALTSDDLESLVLSGPKVQSFYRNLVGDVSEVTNDGWMAAYTLLNQTIFKGGLNKAGTEPGKGTGYLAMNAQVRRTARQLSEMTGETWTPAEVQETIWSWAKTLYESTDAAGEIRTNAEFVLDGALSDELIASTPDFATLLAKPEYAKLLEGTDYADRIQDAARRIAARKAGEESRAGRKASPLAQADQLRHEVRAAKRLDKLRAQRLAAERAASPGELDSDIPFSRKPAKNVYGPVQGDDLVGLPNAVTIKGRGKVEFHGFAPAQEIAKRFAAKNGNTLPTDYIPVDPVRGKRIADAYEAMKHDPQNVWVKRAYQAMIDETLEQYKAILDTGLQVEFIDGEDPYAASPRLAILDVVENNHLWVFPTTDGFGSSDLDVSDNPLLAQTEYQISGRTALANDIFRVVHDYFGHIANGVGFRADGEDNAWREHVRMYSKLAGQAMTTETRGQNSYVNFGPNGEANRTASGADTKYADQKTGLLPQWAMEETPTVVASRSSQTDTPEFKRWFGDSKVVNEDGSPRVVYHGTGANIEQFDNSKAARGMDKNTRGVPWFSTAPEVASGFAGWQDGSTVGGVKLGNANVLPVYLSIQNPLVDTKGDYARSGGLTKADVAELEAEGYDGIHWPQSHFDLPDTTDEGPVKGYYRDRFGQAWGEREEGYPDQWAVFRPNQIKSAAGNSGAFSAEDDSIVASRAKPFSAKKRQADAISVSAVHYSTQPGLNSLDPKKAGTAAAGGERRRFGMGNFGKNGGTSARLAFYVQDGEELPGPEDVVAAAGGIHGYRVQLDNLYDLSTDPRGIRADSRNADEMEEAISDAGYDGFYSDAVGGGINVPVAVVFDIGNKKIPVEPIEDSIVASRAPTFYSAAERAIEKGIGAPKKADATVWKGWLDGAVRRGEMKSEERDWIGIDAWLESQDGPVSRADLLGFVRANQVQVDEKLMREEDRTEGREPEMVGVDDDGEAIYDDGVPDTAKYAKYQLPGGTNYRELLLTLPEGEATARFDVKNEKAGITLHKATTREAAQAFIDGWGGPGKLSIIERAAIDRRAYRSSHWDQPNILAHVRFNERTDAEGKRVLFLEEVQSDWHQAGRKEGYKKNTPFNPAESIPEDVRVIDDRKGTVLSSVTPFHPNGSTTVRVFVPSAAHDGGYRWIGSRTLQTWDDADAVNKKALELYNKWLEDVHTNQRNGVPDAPFKTTWPMLAFKRMVRWAAEHGFDKIAWTTGAQQNARYSLANTISSVKVEQDKPDGRRFLALSKVDGGPDVLIGVEPDGTVFNGASQFLGNPLSDVIGADLAARVMDAKDGENIPVSDVQIGSEGMKGFYDKILPTEVNKWAKRFGGKTDTAEIQTNESMDVEVEPSAGGFVVKDVRAARYLSDESINTFANRKADAQLFSSKSQAERIAARYAKSLTKQHAIEITPAMKDAALEGLPLFSRGVPLPPPSGVVPLSHQLDEARERLQDRMLRLRRTQEHVGSVADVMNAYDLENMMYGAAKDKLEAADRDFVRKLQVMMKRSGLTVDQLQDYLIARHAPERNAQVAKINPAIQDAGSGISTAQAQAILAGTAPGPFSGKALTPDDILKAQAAAKVVDAMRERTLDTLVASGQITPALAATLRATYKHYVPLRGTESEPDWASATPGTGKGLSVARNAIKRALGRGQDNTPVNILGEMAGDLQRAIVQGEKAVVTQAFLKFAKANPMPDLFTVEPVDMEWKFSPATGQAYLGVKSVLDDASRSIVVPDNGKFVRIRFEDERLRDAMMHMSVNDLGAFVKYAGAINRWRSAVLTRFNPGFTPINVLRDLQFGLTSVAAQHGAAHLGKTIAGYPSATRALWTDTGSAQRGDASVPDAQKSWDDWAREYSALGVKTGLTQIDDIQDLQKRISIASTTLMQLAAEGRVGRASVEAVRRAGEPILHAIERVNDVTENALRLSLYVSLRKGGMSKLQAGEAAKNVTINFNRKGQYGPVINALFLFFNAAMQGTHATLRVMRNPKVMAFLVAMAGMQAWLVSMMMHDDDEDGITTWDMIPDYVKRTSFVIPLGGNHYVAVPMPYGFNLFPYSGGRIAQWVEQGARPTDNSLFMDMLKSATEAFSPVPLTDGYQGLFGDTMGSLMQLASNKDDMGRTITASNPYADYQVPKALEGRADTPRAYQSMSQLMAKVGGGDLDKREPPIGFLDVSPEQLEFVTNFMAGGLGNIASKGTRWWEQLDADLMNGPMDMVSQAPIASRLLGSANESRAVADRYYGEKGEFTRQLDILKERVRSGQDPDKALADAQAAVPELKGVTIDRYKNTRTYKRPGGRELSVEKDQVKMTETGAPKLKAEPGSAFDTLKEAEKKIEDMNRGIRTVRAPSTTNAQIVELVGNFLAPPEGAVISNGDDVLAAVGLERGYNESAVAPNRVRQRAIRALQDIRKKAQVGFLKKLETERETE